MNKTVEMIMNEIIERENFDVSDAHDFACMISDSLVQEVLYTALTSQRQTLREEIGKWVKDNSTYCRGRIPNERFCVDAKDLLSHLLDDNK